MILLCTICFTCECMCYLLSKRNGILRSQLTKQHFGVSNFLYFPNTHLWRCVFSPLKSVNMQSEIWCCSAICWWTLWSNLFLCALQVLPTSTTGACWERGTARWRWSWRTQKQWPQWWTGRNIKLENTPCSSASSASSTETSWILVYLRH